MTPSALLVHVPDVQAGLDWYRNAFPQAKPVYIEAFDFTVLDINGFSLEIVQADEKVSAGKKGTVLYWSVPCLQTAIAHFLGLGAELYRGPINIENGLSMCQLLDPFGNLIGLRGRWFGISTK
ncbi:glyoxalase/bleomycin resistance/dioxygenase family protein [Photobacterium halotolerans]|uniref:Glyoxalase/bleomycin resistance/dioxygenase family protein n=1 Tax=Photobacterium halotolerans TaxID=265726 RepID=A0A7X4WDA4_9GAMM|nr:glyoxalase/bleomycin resistance/dioxygenase family protein [Photobacterium halotolerans]NAW66666.1 glyoxalase/bleomycin resistance/dioxygenase family protein [Photobacterium halotolerans]